MPAIAQDQATTFQVRKNDIISDKFDFGSILKNQLETLPDVFNISIFPIRITANTNAKPRKKNYIPKELRKWADSLPVRNATLEEEIAIREADNDDGIIMTAEQFKNRTHY
jgi:hypothetical protein